MSDLIAMQIERENQLFRSSVQKQLDTDAKAAKNKRVTSAEKLTAPILHAELEEALKKLFEASSGREKGARYAHTAHLPHAVMADVALRGFWSFMQSPSLRKAEGTFGPTLTSFMVDTLGGTLERTTLFYNAEMEGALQNIAKKTPDQRKLEKKLKKISGDEWSKKERIHAASALWDALYTCGLVSSCLVRVAKLNHRTHVAPTERGRSLLTTAQEDGKFLNISATPLVAPPKPWRSLRGGGYHTKELQKRFKLAKLNTEGIQVFLGESEANTRRVMGVVNGLQDTPLAINEDALALRKLISKHSLTVPSLTPLWEDVEAPAEAMPDDSEARKWALYSMAKTRKEANERAVYGRAAWDSFTALAEDLATFEQFYLSYFLDRRGRIYPNGVFHHHLDDSTKGMIEFRDAKPLGERGLKWLMIHVANTGDFEKVSKAVVADRLAWVSRSLDAICEMVADPLENPLWIEADAPFSFYAACCDLVRALSSEKPEDYCSRIPCALDGSNSGIQHYSAALRAPEGRLVCLTNDVPQDLYSQLAKDTLELLKPLAMGLSRQEAIETAQSLMASARAAREEGLKQEAKDYTAQAHRCFADIWLDEGVTRSVVKRAGMTYCYSSNAFGFGEHINKDYMAPLNRKFDLGELEEHPFGDGRLARSAAGFLGMLCYRAIQNLLPLSSQGMKWIQKTASILAKEGHGLRFTTPMGMPVHCKTIEQVPKRLVCSLMGFPSRTALTTLEPCPERKIDTTKQRSSSPPHTIHACDAAHLMAVAEHTMDHGGQLLLVHDAFATHAGDCDTLSWTLRDQLAKLYENWCPFEAIRANAEKVLSPEAYEEVPPIPEKGSLDLGGIRHALYSFM